MSKQIETVTPDEAIAEGFARFNGGPHLTLDIPDGHFTISCKQSNGKRVTLSFVSYQNAEGIKEDPQPAGCLDVQASDEEDQQWIIFEGGFTGYHFEDEENKRKATLATLVL